jgi:hypothetical protein
MRRTAILCLVVALLVAGTAGALAPRAAAQAQPPHAWLFGSWTGGLFPAPPNLSAQACLGQPVVIFTRDVVLRATLTDLTYTQRLVETARTNPGMTEFRFIPAQEPASGGLLNMPQPTPPAGFGCGDPNVLHVQRHSENEISFPGCVDFPYPLVRCSTR